MTRRSLPADLSLPPSQPLYSALDVIFVILFLLVTAGAIIGAGVLLFLPIR